MDRVQASFQAETKRAEEVGQFITTDEKSYYTDESPEYSNPSEYRFIYSDSGVIVRANGGFPTVRPRFFHVVETVIVNRVELSEKDWLKLQSEEVRESYLRNKANR